MKLIVGNWKMYPKTLAEAKEIARTIKKSARKYTHAKIVVCPPTLYIAPVLTILKGSGVSVGAQNTYLYNEGAYTGETSPVALIDIGGTYAIVGHSERRAQGESDALIAQKSVVAVGSKLKVILCVGESVRDDAGEYFTGVGSQLRASLEGFPKTETKRLVIAYEPIWAIGSKATRVATPEDFREMSVFIRRNLVDKFGKKPGFAVPILYGGSVDERNSGGFLNDAGADGLLVGRASLDPQKFSAIISSVL